MPDHICVTDGSLLEILIDWEQGFRKTHFVFKTCCKNELSLYLLGVLSSFCYYARHCSI